MNFADKLIKDFEDDSDHRMAFICRIMMLLMALVILLNVLKVFNISNMIYPTVLAAMVVLFIPTVLYDFMHIRSRAARYFVLTLMVLMSGLLYSILSYHAIIMLVFPVVVSCLYCDRPSVLYTTLLSVPVMIISHLIAFHLKIVPDEPLITMKGVVLYGIVPRLIEFMAISVISMSVTGKLQRLISVLVQKNNELYADQQTLVSSLAELVEAQSRETGQHVKRVASYTEILCDAMGMSKEETWKVSVASMMHDIGKIGVPQDILHKPSRLTDSEFEEIKKHVDYGYKLLKNSPGEIMQIAACIAQQHHEYFDGKGYQHNLKGDEINIYARCVAIADVFDALVSKRCYKNAWTPEEARAEIVSQRGSQFDPKLVELFDSHFDEFIAVMEQYPD